MGKIRVRAIIIDKDRILLIKRVKKTSVYWVLPGGGLEKGETHEETATRECKEELGVDVAVLEYFDAVATKYLEQDQENLFYICRIIGGEIGTGEGPEYQEGDYYEGKHIPEWVSIERFQEIDIRPEAIKDKILDLF